MFRTPTPEDYRRDAFVFQLLFGIARSGRHVLEPLRLHEVFPFFLLALSVEGVKGLEFFRDIVTGMYPALSEALTEAKRENILFDKVHDTRDISHFDDWDVVCGISKKFEEHDPREEWEREATKLPVQLAVRAYERKVKFTRALRETYILPKELTE